MVIQDINKMDDARVVDGNCPCQETVSRWLTEKKEVAVGETRMENIAPGGPPISFITQKEDAVGEKKMENTAIWSSHRSDIIKSEIFG